MNGVRFQTASDCALLVYFGEGRRAKVKGTERLQEPDSVSLETHEQVRKFVQLLALEPISGVVNLHPGYGSVLVDFDARRLRHETLQEMLSARITRMNKVALPPPREVEIPVCYGGEFGPDLKDVAALHGLTTERVVQLHSECLFRVYFLGFVPGFAYLGELPNQLVTPRLSTPRKSVPAGSVGIAKNQTGVYPVSTPGGWRLLGRTPAAMFQPSREGMSLLAIGDRVRFVPISPEKFSRLADR